MWRKCAVKKLGNYKIANVIVYVNGILVIHYTTVHIIIYSKYIFFYLSFLISSKIFNKSHCNHYFVSFYVKFILFFIVNIVLF